MSEEIRKYIKSMNTFLKNSNPKIPKTRKKQKGAQLFNYTTIQEIESLCKRAIILHTEGVYVRPPQNHSCTNKNKRKRTEKKFDRGPDAKMPKTTFGSGSVGVSCENYGVQNCTCCAPRNEDMPMHLINKVLGNNYQNNLLLKHPKPKKMFHKPPSDFIDLTNTYEFGQSSTPKKWDNSVICLSDSSPNNSLHMISDKVINLDDDDFQANIENINLINTSTVIKTKNCEIPNNENITDYSLKTSDYNEVEMKKFEEELEESILTDVKTEVLDTTASNFANVKNVTDYIDLVTTDYNYDEVDFENTLAESIFSANIEPLSVIPENTTKNVPKKDVPQIVTNEVNLPKTVDNNSQETVQIFDSPQVSSMPPSNSSPPGLSCPICLETLNKKEVMSTFCGHLFCAECIREVIKKTKSCPTCRQKLTLKRIHPIYLG